MDYVEIKDLSKGYVSSLCDIFYIYNDDSAFGHTESQQQYSCIRGKESKRDFE